ncbi:cellulose biosynthesis protein BcsQ [Povalibacter uvarum]|uniref:Cellulose biosynthesis protein BcsQ n=1 Tax=Povalibacter uvarum TaxID=732238 RepID=A0A841HTG3_9GAMM|nr:ParA family protein [Povalibacter uvarum]MBB6096186.1 cellulose biosynthesis protein BcsQ [Povalibacter uvarum]
MKSIAVFNNKGGVGKTTFLCNLASSLARHQKKRVLVVDADPQCNATQYMFDDLTIDKIYEQNDFTLLDVVKPLAQGKGFVQQLRVRHSEAFEVDVIPGDPGMSLEEDRLATDWVQATGGDIRGLRTTFLFSQLLSQCGEYDFVFFDMGPSLGSINRAVLVAVDYFVTPMSTDIFSVRAIDNISLSLSSWRKKLERALEDVADSLEDLEIDDPRWRLQFLGYITQQYTAKTVGEEKRPVKAFDKIAKKIPVRIEKQLIAHFTSRDLPTSKFELGSIPTLHSLVPLAQSAHTPIFALKASDGVVGAHFTKVKEYASTIREVAKRFESQVDALS